MHGAVPDGVLFAWINIKQNFIRAIGPFVAPEGGTGLKMFKFHKSDYQGLRFLVLVNRMGNVVSGFRCQVSGEKT